MLILDEATSSIDTRTERLIEKGMDRLMENRTVFVIAHRLSTVRNAKAILVLEKGTITSAETMRSCWGKRAATISCIPDSLNWSNAYGAGCKCCSFSARI